MAKVRKLVAFDCDGVLVDSRPLVERILERHCHKNKLQLDFDEMFRDDPRDYLQSLGVDLKLFIHEVAARYHQAPLRTSTLEVIKSLRQKQPETKIVIVTANETQIVRHRLSQYRSQFDGIYGHHSIDLSDIELPSQVVHAKAKQLCVILDRFDVAPSQACLIGDTTSDLDAAEQANVAGIAITGGFQSLRALKKRTQDIVQSKEDLLQRLGLSDAD